MPRSELDKDDPEYDAFGLKNTMLSTKQDVNKDDDCETKEIMTPSTKRNLEAIK